MFVRISAALAAISLLSGAAFAQGAAKPTDPQIAHIAYTAGVLDVTAAKQALAKSSNKDIKSFAQDVVRDHEAVNQQALALVKKLNVTPEDNDTSRALSKQAAAKLAEMEKLKDEEFDRFRNELLREVFEFPFVEISPDDSSFDMSGFGEFSMAKVGRGNIREALGTAVMFELAKMM